MTTICLLYLIVGLLSLSGPFAVMFFKKRVLGAQWMMSVSLLLFGLSLILYSTFFNNFLRGEYLLVVLYMILSLAVLPLTQAAAASLTRPGGIPLGARVLVIPSALMVVAMFASILIGGADMYRLWIIRGSDAMAGVFFDGSWKYNLIVSIHFYAYWAVLVFELVYVVVYAIVGLRRFKHLMGEYYTTERVGKVAPRLVYLLVGLNSLCVLVSYILFPFNSPRPLWSVALLSALESVCVVGLGFYTFRLRYSAEYLGASISETRRYRHGDLRQIGRLVTRVVEEDEGYIFPDISVFYLASKFRVPQDDIVDAVHRLHGTSFSEYIDNLRIERALRLLRAYDNFSVEKDEHLDWLAHSCGYLSAAAFKSAFQKVTQSSVEDWLQSNR